MMVHAGPQLSAESAANQLSCAEIAAVVAMAGRASSLHNTQPWTFRPRGGSIELLADTSRMLPAVDPDGRELTMSCGAALFGLRLGMRSLGRVPFRCLNAGGPAGEASPA